MKKAVLIFLVLLTSCAAVDKDIVRKPEWATPVEIEGVPNLYKVNDILYRSGQPTKEGMISLKEMGIKTVINLRHNYSDKNEIGSTGLRMERVKINPWKIKDKNIITVLKILEDESNAPYLIHCRKGSDRTGIVCAMYRIIYEGWSKEDALDEMINGGYGYHNIWGNIKEYLKNTDVEHLKHEIKEQQIMKNSIFLIAPYKHEGTWVFDDANAGLSKEPFVSGADTIIDKLTADIPNADKGFRLLFSASPFPGYTLKLDWKREEYDGNWYYCEKYDMEGWLCPALFKYFDSAPREIYVKAEVKK